MATVLVETKERERKFPRLVRLFESLNDDLLVACAEKTGLRDSSAKFSRNLYRASRPAVLAAVMSVSPVLVHSAMWWIYAEIWMKRTVSGRRRERPEHLFLPTLLFLLECEQHLGSEGRMLQPVDLEYALVHEVYSGPVTYLLKNRDREDLFLPELRRLLEAE